MLKKLDVHKQKMLYNFELNKVQKALEKQARIWRCLLFVQAQVRVLEKRLVWAKMFVDEGESACRHLNRVRFYQNIFW